MYPCRAWQQSYDHRPSHPYEAETEHVGFSPARQTSVGVISIRFFLRVMLEVHGYSLPDLPVKQAPRCHSRVMFACLQEFCCVIQLNPMPRTRRTVGYPSGRGGGTSLIENIRYNSIATIRTEGVPGGLVGGPCAHQDQFRGFKYHRVHARRVFFLLLIRRND